MNTSVPTQSAFSRVHFFIALVVVGLLFLAGYYIVLATTPNPGHPWTGVGDGTFQVTGPTVMRTFTFPDADATVLTSAAAVTVAQGGTGRTSLTSGNVLLGDGTSAVQLVAPSTDENWLVSNGTTWSSQGTTGYAAWPVAQVPAGATSNVTVNSLTSRNVGLIHIPTTITVNQITFNTAAVTTAGTVRFCVYDEEGTSKLIDVTKASSAVGVNNITVSSVLLPRDNYYIVFGCAVTCNMTVAHFNSSAMITYNTTAVPSGKQVAEGTVTHTSGTCDSSLGTITGAEDKTIAARLDN